MCKDRRNLYESKKIIALLLPAILVIFALAGCGKNGTDTSDNTTSPDTGSDNGQTATPAKDDVATLKSVTVGNGMLNNYFNNGEDIFIIYQMNVGLIRICDGSAVKPSAPTGLEITGMFTDTNEHFIKEW